MTTSRELSIIVQGPIHSSPENRGSGDITRRCLASIRRFFPQSEIVLSTWENADTDGLDFDLVVKCPDPGAMAIDDGARARIFNNVNRQIVSTRHGLAMATRPRAVKFRGDLIFESDRLLFHLDSPEANFSPSLFRSPVVLCSHFSVNPRQAPFLYHYSDLVQAGRTEDLRCLWSVPLAPEPENTRWLEGKRWPLSLPPQAYLSRYAPEQYLAIAFLTQMQQPVSLRHPCDISPRAAIHSERIFVDNFISLDPDMMGVRLPERLIPKGNQYRRLYRHSDWQRLHLAYQSRWKGMVEAGLVLRMYISAFFTICSNIFARCRMTPLYRRLRDIYRDGPNQSTATL